MNTENPPSTARERRPAGEAADAPASGTKALVAASRFKACALMVAERIDTKRLAHLPVVAQLPFMVRLPGGGVAALFRYGAMTLFAEEPGDRAWLLGAIDSAVSGRGDAGTEEQEWVETNTDDVEGPTGDAIRVRDAGRERLQLVSEALAKAALLSFYERRAAADFDRIEPLAQDLADDGRFSANTRVLLKEVGSMLLSEHQLTGRAEVMDKPELLWENPTLEGLYARLESEFELRDRAIALERKLGTLWKTADILMDTLRHESTYRVEWYIVALIVIEIIITLYQEFIH